MLKHLGSEVFCNCSTKAHTEKRRLLALAAVAKLKTEGIINNLVGCQVKARLYNTFIRPILFYGVECFALANEQIKVISVTEGKTLKGMLSI